MCVAFGLMQFGSLQLKSNLFLSPLAGYTNLPFRLVLREVGGLCLATTDLVNARSLLERNPKALKLIETNEADSPFAVQLFGAVPEEMRDAAQCLLERRADDGHLDHLLGLTGESARAVHLLDLLAVDAKVPGLLADGSGVLLGLLL